MIKKYYSVIIAIILLINLTSCTVEKRMDCSSLAKRLSQIDESYYFDEKNIFMADGTCYIYYSFKRPSDILLTAVTDNNKLITKLTLTIIKEGSDEIIDTFRNLAVGLTQIFMNPENIDDINKETRLFDSTVIFSNNAYTYEKGKYKAVFFNAPIAASYVLSSE